MDTLDEVLQEFKHVHPEAETREEQIQMMRKTFESMKQNQKIAIHAPTGTGKTLGYLLPYLAMKLKNPEFTMTISTYSISLQEQLIQDMKMVDAIYQNITKRKTRVPKKLKTVVMKGRDNYFCQHRFYRAAEEEELSLRFQTECEEGIPRWLESGISLDKQNIPVKSSQEDWSLSQVKSCLEEDCPFHDSCTYYSDYFSKRIDLYITNHALFLTRHLFVDKAWENVSFHVFDEAHKLEKTMLEASTFTLSIDKMEQWFLQGLNLANKYVAEREVITSWAKQHFFENEFLKKFRTLNEKIADKIESQSISVKKSGIEESMLIRIFEKILEWQRTMATAWEQMVDADTTEKKEFKEDKAIWFGMMGDLQEFIQMADHPQQIGLNWFEKTESGRLLFKVTPKDIKEISTPFTKGLLFTSGTLAQQDTCMTFAKRMGVTLHDQLILPTPFDLKTKSLVYIAKDCNPKKPNYADQLEKEILRLLQAGKGKTFILFTSTELLRMMHARLRLKIQRLERPFGQPVEIWQQEKDNFKDVMDSFRNLKTRSVLFGTLTYFEGIDLKEEALTQIILTRMPYSVPNHPIQEILDQQDKFSEWEAGIRYEQAYGRLIRSQKDYGNFAVLDERVLKFPTFLKMFREESVPITHDIEQVREFFKNK